MGRLTLTDGAALATSRRDRARVRAPEVWEPKPDGRVEGSGWVLEPTPGWHTVPGPRPGDLRLEREPDGRQATRSNEVPTDLFRFRSDARGASGFGLQPLRRGFAALGHHQIAEVVQFSDLPFVESA